jgi:predicted amidohydrolase
MKAALIHLATRDTPEATLGVALPLIEEAHSAGANLVVLPELWSSGYRYELAGQSAGIVERLKAVAASTGLTLVGSLLEPAPAGKFYNRIRVLGPKGETHQYSKSHLIPAFNEPATMVPGPKLTTLELGGFKLGLAICFDLRFPEMFRLYAIEGVDLFVMPSAWPGSRAYPWELLSKARAAENQAYLLGANHAEEPFGAPSFAIDPMGQEMARLESEGMQVVELNPQWPRQLRRDFPVLSERRPDLYRGLADEKPLTQSV